MAGQRVARHVGRAERRVTSDVTSARLDSVTSGRWSTTRPDDMDPHFRIDTRHSM